MPQSGLVPLSSLRLGAVPEVGEGHSRSSLPMHSVFAYSPTKIFVTPKTNACSAFVGLCGHGQSSEKCGSSDMHVLR